ncbi:MAG TPA: hypothetical protein VGI82_02215 [Chitinophagaceae bacterium]
MKKIFLIVIFVFALTAPALLHAQEINNTSAISTDYKTAIGIRLTDNRPIVANSITLKHFIKDDAAIEGYFSFSDPLAIGAMYELYKPFSTPGLRWYYGAGAYLGFGKDFDQNKQRNVNTDYFGAQGVIGIDYKFASVPINISVDWKPELNLVSDITFEPSAFGLSTRFTFGK